MPYPVSITCKDKTTFELLPLKQLKFQRNRAKMKTLMVALVTELASCEFFSAHYNKKGILRCLIFPRTRIKKTVKPSTVTV